MSDTDKDFIETKVLADIAKTGFPLELRVAHELLTRGFFVQHNLFYVDKDEQKEREIEIVALKNSQSAPRDAAPMWVRNMLLVFSSSCIHDPAMATSRHARSTYVMTAYC
jgi:hypothetical protein